MDEFKLTCIERLAFRWKRREPLTETWRGLDGGERDIALEFWREASEFDAWTFDGLADLLRECRAASPRVPRLLLDWGLAVAAGERRRPVRTGPKTDHKDDMDTMIAVQLCRARLGESKRAACRAVADATNRSYGAVRDAFARGDAWPVDGDSD